jgi:cobalt-zinc-cadmium efflux system membrane fusion protein
MRRHALALLLAGWACTAAEPTAAPAPARPAVAEATAAVAALCPHGVQANVCPKCNPRLAAVFQAKGDWCAEHGFPESFCPLCHPERGGRPAADTRSDGAPADGTKVRLASPEIAGKAGIQTSTAAVRAGGARISAAAAIQYDAARHAEVYPRAAGVVRAIDVDVGGRVRAGASLATLESAAVAADQSRLGALAARVRAAEGALARERALLADGIASVKSVAFAEQELAEARAELTATEAALGMVGSGAAGSRYAVTSPLAGTVIRRQTTLGRLVDATTPLFTVADTRRVWLRVDVQEADATAVTVGQAVQARLDGLPDRTFTGTIEYVSPEIDPRTRTVEARASLDNADGVLKVNMYGRAEIALGAQRETVMVPREAVQRAKGVALVFVRLAADEYEARRVTVGLTDGDLVELTRGVKPGEAVATRGSFLLKTETLKGSIGAGCCGAD